MCVLLLLSHIYIVFVRTIRATHSSFCVLYVEWHTESSEKLKQRDREAAGFGMSLSMLSRIRAACATSRIRFLMFNGSVRIYNLCLCFQQNASKSGGRGRGRLQTSDGTRDDCAGADAGVAFIWILENFPCFFFSLLRYLAPIIWKGFFLLNELKHEGQFRVRIK